MKTSRPTTIKIDESTKERLKRIAKLRNRTPHWMMLEAIGQYVDREEKREAFRQAGIDAWSEFQETGLHVTGDEVVEWLETWGDELHSLHHWFNAPGNMAMQPFFSVQRENLCMH